MSKSEKADLSKFSILQKLVDPQTFQTIMSDVEEPSKIKLWYEEFKKCIKTWYEVIKNCFVSTRCFKMSAEFFAKVKMWFQEFKTCCVSTGCYKKVREMLTSETKNEDEIRQVIFIFPSKVPRFYIE